VSCADPSELLAILDEQETLAREFLELAERERAAIVRRDGEALAGVVAVKTGLAERMAAAERRRLAWVARWAATDRPEEVRLRDVIRALPPEQTAGLRRVRATLARHTAAAAEANRRNGALLVATLGHVRAMLRRLGAVEDAGYAPREMRGGRMAILAARALDLRA
jgi:flagellar biosynthesis/type III secretory pathway chaperone